MLTAINTDCDSMNAEKKVILDPNARYRSRDHDSSYDMDENYEDEEGG